jgi:hypothetical protein
MPLVGFEPEMLAIERHQTYALDRTATGIGIPSYTNVLSGKFPIGSPKIKTNGIDFLKKHSL